LGRPQEDAGYNTRASIPLRLLGQQGVSYRREAAVLEDLLPMGAGRVSNATLRRHTLRVGARLNERVSEPGEYDWPESRREPGLAARNLSVAIDGTYIRADRLMWGIWGIAKIRAKTDTAHWILQIPAQFNSYLPALQFTGPLKCLR
jgi:hypothetical protein